MMKKRNLLLILLIVFVAAFLSGCVPGDGTHADKPAGFFWGIWHGWIAPVSLIIGIFKKGVRIYETANDGWWYDFGFYIAIISGFGGLSLARGKKNRGGD